MEIKEMSKLAASMFKSFYSDEPISPIPDEDNLFLKPENIKETQRLIHFLQTDEVLEKEEKDEV